MVQMAGRKTSIPSPIGGWNASTSQDLMGPTDAIYLINFHPGDSEVYARNGFASHATGLGNNIETLMSYDGAGTQNMFGIAGTSVFNVTAAGAVGAAVVTGLSGAKWGSLMMATSGGPYLWMWDETGTDAPQHLTGSTWATPTLSSITASDVIGATVHKLRLFMILKNSLKFAYLPVNSIAGNVTTFDLASLFTHGGTLAWVGSWTRDGGAGVDDLICFGTTNGEIAVYQGTDPASASTWSLIGVFKIGAPIGSRCVMKVGADLIILTEAGVVPLSQVLTTGESAPSTTITNKIADAFRNANRMHGSRSGWSMTLYPKGKYAFVNVPVGTTTFRQYVVNLKSGAWTEYRGQNGFSWVVHNKELYFGTNGTVFKADTGANDNGAAIECSGKPAFNYFGSRGQNKQFTMMRPVMESNGALPIQIGFDVDFANGTSTYTASSVVAEGSAWDDATWDSADWATEAATIQAWRSITGIGYCGAPRIKTSTTAQSVVWHSTDILYVPMVGL